jgi:5-methylcytosine-specific restriction protein A
MQFVTVEPESGSRMVVWVKCAWKPGKHGNCAVQMAFPSKEERAYTPEEVTTIVTEKVGRAGQRGATHALLLAADDSGQTPLAAYLVPLNVFGALTEAALAVDVPLTRNGASPSFYITATGPRQEALVNIISLADQGPDTVQNVIALCPEHHREAHYGARRYEMETEMIEKLLHIDA